MSRWYNDSKLVHDFFKCFLEVLPRLRPTKAAVPCCGISVRGACPSCAPAPSLGGSSSLSSGPVQLEARGPVFVAVG